MNAYVGPVLAAYLERLQTGIIIHVGTMGAAIKYMIENGWEHNPGIRDKAPAAAVPARFRRLPA
ncbi:hypothetical protein [Paracoccus sp. APAP_BH8]|uniref:hypothetical protein n=1 Tax=Paracoccus sp. APAP_BH8 TaxID=3110237 RepID=UPI003FA6F2EB